MSWSWLLSPLKFDDDEDGSDEDGDTNGYENCIDVDNGDGVDEMSDKSEFC